MAWNKALQQIKNRSLEKTYFEQLNQQKKTDDKKKEHLKKQAQEKQTQNSQFLAFLFSVRRFQQERLFLKTRLAKLKSRIFAVRNRKRQLALSQQLRQAQEALEDLDREQKKKKEEHRDSPKHFHLMAKSLTPLRNISNARAALLKKQKEFPLYAKQLGFWK